MIWDTLKGGCLVNCTCLNNDFLKLSISIHTNNESNNPPELNAISSFYNIRFRFNNKIMLYYLI